MVAVATVFTLARFSEAFLILRAQNVGLPIMLVPAVLVADECRLRRRGLSRRRDCRIASSRIGRCWRPASLLLIAADLALALLPSIGGVALGVVLWGLHMGLTQGLLAALVADTAPAELRGTAYGFFNLLGGLAMLAASIIAGALWDIAGPQGTFLAGAGFALVALAGLLMVAGKIGGRPDSPPADPDFEFDCGDDELRSAFLANSSNLRPFERLTSNVLRCSCFRPSPHRSAPPPSRRRCWCCGS